MTVTTQSKLPLIGIGIMLAGFAYTATIKPAPAPEPDYLAAPAAVVTTKPAGQTSQQAAIEKTKKCAHDLRVERARWFYSETGLTTTYNSGAAQSYANQMEEAGMETKTPIPFRLCG